MKPLDILLAYIDEDSPEGDITSDAVIPDVSCSATIKAEDNGIVAGLEEAKLLLSHFGVSVPSSKQDGDEVCRGDQDPFNPGECTGDTPRRADRTQYHWKDERCRNADEEDGCDRLCGQQKVQGGSNTQNVPRDSGSSIKKQ